MGDQAQTVAIEKFINKKFPDYRLFCFDREEYGSKEWVRITSKINKNDVIIFSSTGDFGSRYFHIKNYLGKYSWADVRRNIVEKYLENKIIQLPVTVYYGDTDDEKVVIQLDKKIYSNAENFVILCREPVSCSILDQLDIGKHFFFPDFVFYYKPRIHSFKRNGILLTLRNGESAFTKQDKERIAVILKNQSLIVDDKDIMRAPFPVYESVREKYLEKICMEIQKYQLMVTDRMHGMILAVITQTPCVVLDAAIPHKISGYESFLGGAVQFARNINALDGTIKSALQSEYRWIDIGHYFDEFREKFFENDYVEESV